MPDDLDASDNAQDPAVDIPISADAPTDNLSPPDAVGADAQAVFLELCEVVRSCAAPSALSSKWGFLSLQDTVLRIDMPPNLFMAALEQEYTTEALSAFGFYDRVDDELRLRTCFEGDAPIYAQIDMDRETIAFSRRDEFLFPMQRTALDYALERIPPDSTLPTEMLFVVASPDSVEVLQWLGQRAVCSEGLESVGFQDVQRLFDGDQRTDFHWRYFLVLVNFDVAKLDTRPANAIREVIERLSGAGEVYKIDLTRRFGVCQPSKSDFDLLERAISFGDSAHIAKLFEAWASAARSVRVSNWRTHLENKAVSFSVARAALTRALQLPDVACRLEVMAALPAYRAASRTAVIDKFCGLVDSATDPFETLDLIRAADIAETLFASDPLVQAGEAVLAGRTLPPMHELQAVLIEQQERCMVEFRRIRRDRKAKR